MITEELEKVINEMVERAIKEKTQELTKYIEVLERRIETLATEIKILKEGGNF